MLSGALRGTGERSSEQISQAPEGIIWTQLSARHQKG